MGIYDPNQWPGPRNSGLRTGFRGNPHAGKRRSGQDLRLAVTIGLAVGAVATIVILILR